MQNRSINSSEDSVKMGRIGARPKWVLNFSLLLRATHQVGAAVFLASFLLDVVPGPPSFYVLLTVASGGLLFVTEWMRHRQSFRELSGVTSLVKTFFLGAAYHGILPPQGTVLVSFFVASVVTHAPKKVRHRLLF